jgi:hypothetical protein
MGQELHDPMKLLAVILAYQVGNLARACGDCASPGSKAMLAGGCIGRTHGATHAVENGTVVETIDAGDDTSVRCGRSTVDSDEMTIKRISCRHGTKGQALAEDVMSRMLPAPQDEVPGSFTPIRREPIHVTLITTAAQHYGPCQEAALTRILTTVDLVESYCRASKFSHLGIVENIDTHSVDSMIEGIKRALAATQEKDSFA